MYRHILFFLFLFILTSPVRAQLFSGGLKFGMTQTTYSGNLDSGETIWDPISGIAGGVTGELSVLGPLSVAGEIQYVRMGAQSRVRYNSFPSSLTSRTSYLSLPLFAQLNLGPSGIVVPRFFVGGAALIELESVILVEADMTSEIFIEENSSIESFDYGLIVGLGIDFNLASQRLTLEVRYYNGQNDVSKPTSELGEETVLNNRGWAIMTGVLF
ncbi:MAG: porin family protein [Bacteroidetes bacterium]|nr:porin family protein [Bacteroidota bacterium]MCY4233631.1 porin family protein [Bacteroidota bacterium]